MSESCELSSYAELIEVVTNLRFLVREKRRRERLSLAAVAVPIGMAPSTVYRFEQGKDVSTDNLVQLIRWVGDVPAAPEVKP